MSETYSIQVSGIRKSFGELLVLDGIDLAVKRGTVVALLGPNGAGKTTMVKILSTLLTPDGGTASIEGLDLLKRAEEVRSVIGLTGQYAAIDEYLSGRENLQMMGALYHLSKADTLRRTEELLAQFDLMDAADRQAKTYSGGMSRRLDLAASLIASPPVIFLDEPTTGLDPRSRLAMWDAIKALIANGSTILLTTQYLEEADQLADRIVVIDGGKVIAEGTANELKAKVGSERIEFVFESDEDYRKATKVIDGNSVQMDAKRRLVSVANDGGVGRLRDILDNLEKAGAQVAGLSLHKPTLDDVFMDLTGHEAEKGAEEGKSDV